VRLRGALEKAEDALLLGLRNDWAHFDLVPLGRIADLERFDRRHELVDELVVDLGAGDDARAGCAVLSRVPKPARANSSSDRGRIRVVEDDDGRLAPQLEVHALERLGGRLGDLPAGRNVPG